MTVGSSRFCSSPTSALAIAARIAGVGRVAVSERRSIIALTPPGSPRPLRSRVDLDLLESTLAERGEPAYRGRQVWGWAAGGADGYEAMTNVPARCAELADARAVLDADGRAGAVRATGR